MHTIKPAIRALALTALGISGTQAASIALNNASFEDGGAEWTIFSDFDGWGEYGNTGKAPVARTGTSSLWNCWSSGWNQVSQNSTYTVAAAGEAITASVWVKTDGNLGGMTATFNLALLIDGIADFTEGQFQGGQDWTELTFTYTTTAADVGKVVGLYLGNDAGDPNGPGSPAYGDYSQPNYTYMDDASLSVVAVPEPSAALLGGIGVLALLRRRRA